MPFIAIMVAMLIIVGALLWLRPSPREKRLSSLHTQVFSRGLKLRNEMLPDLSVHGRVNELRRAYTLINREYREKQPWPSYTLVRTEGEASKYLLDGWYLSHGPTLTREQIEQVINPRLQAVNEHVVAISQWPLGFGLATDESPAVDIDLIEAQLTLLKWPVDE